MKCCELIDKITSSLATFEVLIRLSLNDHSVIDAIYYFINLQTLYLQVMADIRNVDSKMKAQTEQIFKKYSGRNKESKNVMDQK